MVVELEIRCAPGRPDIRSVEVSTGAALIVAEALVPDHDRRLELLDVGIGRLDGVLDGASSAVLRLLLTATEWIPAGGEPAPVRRALIDGRPLDEPITVDELDRRLVQLLQRDARMSMTRLAAEMNVGGDDRASPAGPADDLARVAPAVVRRAGGAGLPGGGPVPPGGGPVPAARGHPQLAAEEPIRHLAFTTGRSNMLGYSSHRTMCELREFTERALASVPGLRASRTSMLVRTYKRAGQSVCRA